MQMRTEQNFIVHESTIEGRGVFASRDIKKHEVICTMQGDKLSFAEFEKMHERGNTRISCDHLQIGVRTYIALEEPYVFINHSCEPNAGMQGERTLVALRLIKMDEEITYDYSTTEWTVQDYPPYYTDGWPMICRCGSSICRNKIACFPYLPQSIQQKYLETGIIQDHIKLRLEKPKELSRCLVCEANLINPY